MKPTEPIKRKLVLTAFVIGILVPAVIIFLRENTNNKVRGRKDIENLSLPFVGEIPLKTDAGKNKSTHTNKSIVIKQGSRDIINEAFRVLRTNLEFMLDAK